MDVFASHRTQSYKDKLLSMGCEFIYVPAGCTGDLQPLDLSVIDEYKKILKSKFIIYYASVIESSEDDDLSTFKLSASLLKPLHADGVTEVHAEMQDRKSSVIRGFRLAGITACALVTGPATGRWSYPLFE